MSSSLKTAAVAGVMLVASVSGAFAAHFNTDTKLVDGPSKWASTISYADAGDYVKVLNCGPNYCLVKYDGDKGYVKKWTIDFSGPGPGPGPGPFPPYGPHGCMYGPFGYVCV